MACCPTCHQEIPPLQVFIDITDGWVMHAGQSAKLRRQEVQILQSLVRAAPGIASYERILFDLHCGDEPEYALKALSVLIHSIRRKLAGTGLEVRNHYARGYSLHSDPETLAAAKLATPRRGAA